MKYEKLSNLQLEVLHVLWKSIKSQSSEEIIEQLNLGFGKSFLAEYIIEKMISKGLIIKTGEYYAKRHEDSAAEYLYSPSISFGDYYVDRFKSISANNIFHLLEQLLWSKKLDASMLQHLLEIIKQRIVGTDS